LDKPGDVIAVQENPVNQGKVGDLISDNIMLVQ